MEERLKQRLVGAVVLVSLAVVLIPMLLDMPREATEDTSADLISEIPARPPEGFDSSVGGTLDAPRTPRLDAELERERGRDESDAIAGEHPVPSDPSVAGGAPTSNARSESTAATSGEPVSGASAPPSAARPASTQATGQADRGSPNGPVAGPGAAGGWSVQLGSFRKSGNALALRKRLQARGYDAFVESGTSAQGDVSRVFVGPMADREQARASAAKLRREMALEGFVVRYPGG